MTEAQANQDKTRKGFVKQPRSFFEIKEMTANVAFVWNFLSSHSEKYHPSLAEICEKTKLSKMTVVKIIKNLESYNMLKVIRSKRGVNKIPNKYFPILDESMWSFPSCIIQHHDHVQSSTMIMYNPRPLSRACKESKEENIICNTVLQPVDNVDNSDQPIPDDNFDHIFKKYINPIHPWVSPSEASIISKYYTNLLIKNEARTIEVLKIYARKLKMSQGFAGGIRIRESKLVFDTSFKMQFEKDWRVIKI